MNKKVDKKMLIDEIARRAKFTKKDVEIIIDTFVEILIEAVKDNSVILVRSFFKLYTQKIPARKGKDGINLPPTTRVILRLAENIRFADREETSLL